MVATSSTPISSGSASSSSAGGASAMNMTRPHHFASSAPLVPTLSSSAPTGFGRPINTDAPIPPRLVGSPLLAAVASASCSSLPSSAMLPSPSSPPILSPSSAASSLVSPYTLNATARASDSALPSATTSASGSVIASVSSSSTSLLTRQSPQRAGNVQATFSANSESAAASSSGSLSARLESGSSGTMRPLLSPVTPSTAVSGLIKAKSNKVRRPGTPMPKPAPSTTSPSPSSSSSSTCASTSTQPSAPAHPVLHLDLPPVAPASLISAPASEPIVLTPYSFGFSRARSHSRSYSQPVRVGLSPLATSSSSAAADDSDPSDGDTDSNSTEEAEEYFDTLSTFDDAGHGHLSAASSTSSSSDSVSLGFLEDEKTIILKGADLTSAMDALSVGPAMEVKLSLSALGEDDETEKSTTGQKRIADLRGSSFRARVYSAPELERVRPQFGL